MNNNPTEGIRIRYILGLLFIALLAVGTFFILQTLVRNQAGVANVVNVSGRQRMLSQRTALFSLALATATTTEDRNTARITLSTAIDEFETAHRDLIEGNAARGLPGNPSLEAQALLFNAPSNLDQQVRDYINRVRTLIAKADSLENLQADSDLQYILSESPNRLITDLNRLVLIYTAEGEGQVIQLRRIAGIILITSLAAILLVALIAFVPLENMVRRRTQDLIQREQRFRALMNNSSESVTILDRQGQIQFQSENIQKVLGHTAESMQEQNFFSYIHPTELEGLRTAMDSGLGKSGTSMRYTFRIKTAEGSWRWFEATFSNLLKDPVIKGLVVNAYDVTQRMMRSGIAGN